ncbi:hypothetical protein N057_02886, partial [Mycobacterium tuberculosis variant africanum MAL010099]
MVGKLALGSESSRQTQNPERGRKPLRSHLAHTVEAPVVRPKTPRGDGNLCEVTSPTPSKRLSSDPKPREGTETCIRKVRTLETLPTCRQTQNPERGRKPASGKSVRSKRFQRVVRPKTPRGDGNARNRPTWACPQRVVRPKTPRGDGNSITLFLSVARLRVSSDPKPREGTETRKRSTSLTILFSRRQTQNPERGRKHFERELVHSPPFRSSDPKPREGTETPRGWRMRCARKCRQTQNPERGRKPDDEQRHTEPRIRQVVRPKTPRGDGNLHPLVADTADFRESSDPKPREGTETGNCVTARLAGRLSSDPKPREGTETPSDAGTEVDDKPSSDPKPREGTETSTPSVPHTGPVPCRQTQNPERGRKPDGTELSGFY